jgi:hypothetical protein
MFTGENVVILITIHYIFQFRHCSESLAAAKLENIIMLYCAIFADDKSRASAKIAQYNIFITFSNFAAAQDSASAKIAKLDNVIQIL